MGDRLRNDINAFMERDGHLERASGGTVHDGKLKELFRDKLIVAFDHLPKGVVVLRPDGGGFDFGVYVPKASRDERDELIRDLFHCSTVGKCCNCEFSRGEECGKDIPVRVAALGVLGETS